MLRLIRVVAILLVTCVLAQAQQPPQPPAAPDKKEEKAVSGKRAAVVVEHSGADPVGLKLAYTVKELVNRSSLLALTAKDEKKIVVVVNTAEEFAGRPKMASVFGVVWLYSAKDGSLRYYLASQAGTVDALSVEEAAQAIVAKTSATADQFAYLFE